MLHYKNRHNRLHLLTLDRVLLEDMDQRLAEFDGMQFIERAKPESDRTPIRPEDILKLARETTTSRVLILDVRSQTLPLLQRAYSDIVRFNRPDFNRYCYTVLVGDGPRDFLHPDNARKSLTGYLGDLRIDYSAAAFFADPFLFYEEDEKRRMIQERNFLPDTLSIRFDKYFKDQPPSLSKLRRYFRTADKEGDDKNNARKERRKALKKLIARILRDALADDKEAVRRALSPKGLEIPGQTLRCGIYPFYFEQQVLKLFQKAQSAVLE